MKTKLLGLLEKFKGKHILVIGDVMLDKYIWGSVERISPEAPVQIVDVKRENYSPGGAANTANNIFSLSANVHLISLIGNDGAGKILIKELKRRNIDADIVKGDKKPTIQKTRIMAHNQQLLRIDREDRGYIKKDIEDKIIKYVKDNINKADAIVVSDYAKGIVTKTLMEKVNQSAKGKIVVVDPKSQHKEFYKDATLITPNHKEACGMLNLFPNNCEDIKNIGTKLQKELKSNILITRGEKGMSLFDKEGHVLDIPTAAKEVYDVSGAGDTVVAVTTLALTAGATLKQAAILANHAAGIVVGKVGTATLTVDEIKKSLENE